MIIETDTYFERILVDNKKENLDENHMNFSIKHDAKKLEYKIKKNLIQNVRIKILMSFRIN